MTVHRDDDDGDDHDHDDDDDEEEEEELLFCFCFLLCFVWIRKEGRHTAVWTIIESDVIHVSFW